MMDVGVDWFQFMGSWFARSQMCSPASHYLVYSIIASSAIISAGGVYFYWWRFIRPLPVKG